MTDSISTQYLSSSLQLSVLRLTSQLATAQTESTTGQYADLALQLGASSGEEISLQNQNGVLENYTSNNTLISTRITAASNALDSLRTNAQNVLSSLAEWQPGANAGATLQSFGANGLQTLVSSGNTSVDGSYVFAGINSGVAPLTDYFAAPANAQTAIQSAFSTYLSGLSPPATAQTVTATQMQTFLTSSAFTSQFQGANWSANWSSASSTNVTNNISPTETVTTSTSANQPGFQQLAQAYAMLNEFSGTSINASAMQVVVSQATGLVNQSLGSLTATEATLGTAQSRITDANTSMTAQMGILQTQIGNLDNVNAYQSATQVNALTTQLQTAYSLTAQLQKLNLVNYL